MGNLFDKAMPPEVDSNRVAYRSTFSIAMQEGLIEGVDIPVKEKPVYFEDHAFTTQLKGRFHGSHEVEKQR